jgi:predicted RecA/RadA family phage recombinase
MTKYLDQHNGNILGQVAVTHPATPSSGDPVRLGSMTGVALVDEGDGGNAATETTVDIGRRVWDLVVDDNESSGIAVGDVIYYHDTATGDPATSLNNTSTSADAEFGVALETVAADGTERIKVLHRPDK